MDTANAIRSNKSQNFDLKTIWFYSMQQQRDWHCTLLRKQAKTSLKSLKESPLSDSIFIFEIRRFVMSDEDDSCHTLKIMLKFP